MIARLQTLLAVVCLPIAGAVLVYGLLTEELLEIAAAVVLFWMAARSLRSR